MIKRIKPDDQNGAVLVAVIIIFAALTIIGMALLTQASSQFTLTSHDTINVNALYTAEAGVEQSIQQLNESSSFTGYSTPQVFFNDAAQGYGVYTTTIGASPQNANAKLITSYGKIYNYHSTSQLITDSEVQVTVVGTSSPGYSVEGGPGGLILSGSANITNSSVFVNGNITMSGAAAIGTSSQPLSVNVANDACPSGGGASYPTVCTGSTQPISLQYSTYIYGSVCATGQTSTGPNNNIQGGSGGQGLEAGCTTAPGSLPSYNRAAQIAAVTTTAAGSGSNYSCGGAQNVTWPANLELTGNVSVSGSCNVTVSGNVYVTGNFSISGAATMTIGSANGATPPVILADGTISLGGSANVIEDSSKAGGEFISWDSNDSACNPGCTSITGQALYNTQTFQTVSVSGAVHVPGSIFDANWGEVTLSGSGNMGAAAGQTINLSGAGTITFGTDLSSGTSTWTISSYQIIYPGG